MNHIGYFLSCFLALCVSPSLARELVFQFSGQLPRLP